MNMAKEKNMEMMNRKNMEDMELDEIDRLISKRTWERFQIDMDKMEYRRRNSDLEHRIKILRLQINVPKVTISKNIPFHQRINHEIFDFQMRTTFELNELKREKIVAIEYNYHHKVQEIHARSNEIIGMFENLETIKKKRYFENDIHSVRQEVNHLEHCITLSKQQLNQIRDNHQSFVLNFVVQSVIHWKSITIVRNQTHICNLRLNELCNEIEITQNDVTTMQSRIENLHKVYEQLKLEMEIIHSQTPRIIAKLPITYNSLEQDGDVNDSPTTDSPPFVHPVSKRIQILENVVIKPADSIITQAQSGVVLNETLRDLNDTVQSERDTVVPILVDSNNIEKEKVKSQDTRKTEKSKKTTKRNYTDDDKPLSSVDNRPLRKKTHVTGKTVEFNLVSSTSPRKLRNRKLISNETQLSQNKTAQSNKLEQLSQTFKTSPSKHFDEAEHSFRSKDSSPVNLPNTSLLSNFHQNQSNIDSFILNTSYHGSHRTSTDSKEDDFFITNENDGGFDFFQPNDDKDQLFMM